MSYLRELVVQADSASGRAREFDFSVNCVIDLYFSLLPRKLETSPFQKVVLVASGDLEWPGRLENLITVVRLQVPFDFPAYWAAGIWSASKSSWSSLTVS